MTKIKIVNLSENIRDELFSYVIVRHGSKQMIVLILILMMILMPGNGFDSWVLDEHWVITHAPNMDIVINESHLQFATDIRIGMLQLHDFEQIGFPQNFKQCTASIFIIYRTGSAGIRTFTIVDDFSLSLSYRNQIYKVSHRVHVGLLLKMIPCCLICK